MLLYDPMTNENNDLLSNLKFSNKEVASVHAGEDDELIHTEFEARAVGKLFTDCSYTKEVQFWILPSVCYYEEQLQFVAIFGSLVIVKFGSVEDKTKIFGRAPWSFDKSLFAMVEYVEGLSISDYELRFVPF